MNFFYKQIDFRDHESIFCGVYKKNLFHDESEPVTFLDAIKLKHNKKPHIYVTPIFIMGALFSMKGWQEGWDLIAEDVELFLKNNGPTKGMDSISLKNLHDRKEIFPLISKDYLFVSSSLRLEIIKIIESKGQ